MANYKYLPLADSLKSNILEGIYRPGTRIPTEPELCDTFSVSRYMVRQAVALLEEEGFLRRVQGSGTYVAEELPQAPVPRRPATHSNTIGLVMGDSQAYISPEIIRGASDFLTGQGCLLNVALTHGSYDQEKRALDIFLNSHPAGVLLEPVNSGLFSVNYELYQQLNREVPCLLLHSGDIGECRSFSLNDFEGARLLTSHLLELGHTRIGVIFCMEEYTGQKRYCGFLSALRSHGLTHSPEHRICIQRCRIDDLFETAGSAELERLLKTVTAVFCHDDRIAYDLIRYLTKKGIRVPEDISVAGYDDSVYAELALPITTVSHPKAEYGHRAAQALLKMIQSPGIISFADLEPKPELIIRKSTSYLVKNS